MKRVFGRLYDPTAMLIVSLRVSSFFAIAAGVLAFVFAWAVHSRAFQPLPSGTGPFLLPLDEALGLLFTGFAIRLARLEHFRARIRVVAKTAQYSLLILGVAGVLGMRIAKFFPSAQLTTLSARPGFAAGLCFLLLGAFLARRNRSSINSLNRMLSVALVVFLGAAWISLFLEFAGLVTSPQMFSISAVTLVTLTSTAIGLAAMSQKPGIIKLLAGHGPSGMAARRMFAATIAIPLVLAFLRHQAERNGYLDPELGLLTHVLLSIGSMAVVTAWNALRIDLLQKTEASTSAAVAETRRQYHEILSSVQEPVWIFGRDGQICFSNQAALRYRPVEPGDRDTALGRRQQRDIFRAAIFGGSEAAIQLQERLTETVQTLEIRLVRAFDGIEPGSREIVLVASTPLASSTSSAASTGSSKLTPLAQALLASAEETSDEATESMADSTS